VGGGGGSFGGEDGGADEVDGEQKGGGVGAHADDFTRGGSRSDVCRAGDIERGALIRIW
jgi:hypothetical protein